MDFNQVVKASKWLELNYCNKVSWQVIRIKIFRFDWLNSLHSYDALCVCRRSLPLSAMSRVLDTHDVPILLVQLIESPPWSRQRHGSRAYTLSLHVTFSSVIQHNRTQ